MLISKLFSFEAAHHLTNYKGAPEPVHGHSWRLEVTCRGPVGRDGMVLDFAEIGTIVQEKVVDRLDHQDLNGIVENPSAERVAVWIWNEIGPHLPLHEIRVWEEPGCFVTYSGPRSNVQSPRS